MPSPQKEKEDKECKHSFEFVHTGQESTADNLIYYQVAYSVCTKCGEVRKNNL